MTLNQYIDRNLIWIDVIIDNTDQLFEIVAEKAKLLGYVHSNFLERIKIREKNYPTGLKYKNHAIAIPHTDPETIQKQFIAVVIPKNTLHFCLMDDPNKKEAIDIVFVLGLDNPESQLNVLQEVIAMIQDEKKVHQLITAKTINELFLNIKQINL